jgi:hypothetical protein
LPPLLLAVAVPAVMQRTAEAAHAVNRLRLKKLDI